MWLYNNYFNYYQNEKKLQPLYLQIATNSVCGREKQSMLILITVSNLHLVNA